MDTMHRRTALSFLGACAVLGQPMAQAQVPTLALAIQRAGAQRMLSQRMTKAYLMLGMGVQVDKARRVIEDSMARFDRHFGELLLFAPAAEVRATCAELQAAWSEYRTLLTTEAPHRDRVPALIERDDLVMRLADKTALQLEQRLGGPGGIVDLSGRQGMWSQRAAKYFLVRAWRTPVPQADEALRQARDSFLAGVDDLAQARQATPAIRQELDLARQQWVFFDAALQQQSGLARSSEHVFSLSENVLTVMERVTAMYARQVA